MRTRIFVFTLICSLCVTLLNLGCIWCDVHPQLHSPETAKLINDLFFILLPLMPFSLTLYGLLVIYERSTNRSSILKRHLITMTVVCFLHLVMILANRDRHFLYFIDEAGIYHRGPLISLTYLHFLFCLLQSVCAFLPQRHQMDPYTCRVLQVVPLLSGGIVLIHFCFPQLQLNGTAMAAATLVVFGNFQNQRVSTDQLTGLFSRDLFYQETAQLFARKQSFRIVAVKLLDFKAVNRRHGQLAGDEFLKVIASRLQELDKTAFCYRFSGVQFVLITRLEGDLCQQLLRNIRALFSQPLEAAGIRCSIAAAMANISCPGMAPDVNTLTEALEYAVSLSAAEGKPVQFDRNVQQMWQRREHLIRLLRRALKEKAFYLEFQPIRDCLLDRFCSAEVLLRLRDEDGTPVSPGEFIPIAEQTGLIADISWQVLEMTCRFLSCHRQPWSLPLSVNVPIQQLLEPDAAGRILRTLQQYRIQPEQICLEITERTFSSDHEGVLGTMQILRQSGISFHLDDFGTGYSNLATVFSMPFSCVKLDKSLVDSLAQNRNTRLMIRSLVRSFGQIGTELVAEGVETPEQARLVQEIGIRRIQGFCYARPLGEKDFTRLIELQSNGCMPEGNSRVPNIIPAG
ncbi:MAG: bifunctional diguanylate cyclase/phosphodiesterase [Oscillospiraceae bacterium]|nr:bifunctional diguanylate cyclase/phosphodiesterase [Oscillospiraceae bacterium]